MDTEYFKNMSVCQTEQISIGKWLPSTKAQAIKRQSMKFHTVQILPL